MRGRERILGTRLVIGVYTRVVFDVLRLANPIDSKTRWQRKTRATGIAVKGDFS